MCYFCCTYIVFCFVLQLPAPKYIIGIETFIYIAKGGLHLYNLDYPFDAALLLEKKRAIKKDLLNTKTSLIPKKIAIVGGSTIGELKNMLELFLLHFGIEPTFYVGDYNRYYEELVFENAALQDFAPDIIYIHTTNKNLPFIPHLEDTAEGIDEKLQKSFAHFKDVWNGAKKYACPVIQNNFDLPYYRVLGNKDSVDIHGQVRFVNLLNAEFSAYAAQAENFYLNDIHYLSARIGLDNWFSPSAWYLYKYAVAVEQLPNLAHSIALIVKSVLGRNKKSVILDLDNTLWGGIIGEVGSEHIELGIETPKGMAFTEFQTYLKELSEMGVMLNVASKNEMAMAESGFANPNSVLKRDDFISFKANWNPKSQSITEIAQEINILPDSFVFIDDNPAEREIVKQALPDVSISDASTPEEFMKAIDRAGFFEVTTLSADDKKRNDYYKQNIQRQELENSFTDYKGYLLSLNMKAQLGPFNKANFERVTQLINKTNQFNFTTRRYTPAEVEEVMQSSEYITLYGRLEDKFGDNGITSVLIGHIENDVCTIDLWVMSCRVFKRDLELAMFDELVQKCKALGVTKIVGHYYPTAKNVIVKDFYETVLGFTVLEANEKERIFAFTDIADYQNKNEVMQVTID